MSLMKNYNGAKRALMDHVGLQIDWVELPIDDCTELWWFVGDGCVKYAMDKGNVFDGTDEDGWENEIYTQRFYPKHVYRGTDLTLVFCDPQVDGCKWWRIFDNSKQLKEAPE